jgi:hypothetical protein
MVPVLVASRFGPSAGAVFFVAWMAGNTADYAATGFSQSVMVRIAHEPERAWPLLALGCRRVAVLFLPVLALGALPATVWPGRADKGACVATARAPASAGRTWPP